MSADECISNFLSNTGSCINGNGYGCGLGERDDWGENTGSGDGFGSGSGRSDGYGWGDGWGDGLNSGSGWSSGPGSRDCTGGKRV